jgi:hypothetical protein
MELDVGVTEAAHVGHVDDRVAAQPLDIAPRARVVALVALVREVVAVRRAVVHAAHAPDEEAVVLVVLVQVARHARTQALVAVGQEAARGRVGVEHGQAGYLACPAEQGVVEALDLRPQLRLRAAGWFDRVERE